MSGVSSPHASQNSLTDGVTVSREEPEADWTSSKKILALHIILTRGQLGDYSVK